MNDEIRVFIGFDPREAIAYHVCMQSIIHNTKQQVAFYPIQGERRDGSNDFIYARFLVPHILKFEGSAIFMDGDMIVRADIAELAALADPSKAVQCVPHDYKTAHPVKYLGNKNEDYPRKNWSSVMIWNCEHPANKVLTPDYVAVSTGSHLHRFGWLSDDQIGALPNEWNRLVLEEPMTSGDKLRHYTIGTPCFDDYSASDQEWWRMYDRTIAPCT